jgi:hypothetical protein
MAVASSTAALIGAGIGAGSSLYGSKKNRDEQRRATTQANEMNEAQTQRSLASLQPGYEQAMQTQRRSFGQADRINQEALERAMMMRRDVFMPQMQAYEGGNLAAQEANLASLPAMRAAILGGKMPAAMQARSLPINQTALEGLMNPTAQQFRPERQGGMGGGMGMQGGRMGQKVLGSMGMGRRGMGMNQPMNQPMNNRPMTEEEYMQQAMYEQRPTMQFERSRYEMP